MDPVRSKWCASIDLLACAICMYFFKGESVTVFKWLSVVHMVVCEVAIVLQSKSIILLRMLQWSKPKSDNRPYVLIAFSWILVVSNDPYAGTVFTVSVASDDPLSM